MFFRCGKKIRTVKILETYNTAYARDFNKMLNLELKLKDGGTLYENIEHQRALKKYNEFFYNPQDENYEHNQIILCKKNMYDDVIPMHEDPSDNSKCILS